MGSTPWLIIDFLNSGTGWQFRIGKIGKIGSASANFPIGRNSVGRAVKFCRKNRGIGKIGGSAKSADRQNRQIGKSRQKRPRAQRNALIGWAPDVDSTTHTHLPHHYTKPKQPDFLTASFSYLIGWNWALHVTRKLSIHSQGFNIIRRFFSVHF